MQGPVQDGEIGGQLGLARVRQPNTRALGVGERLADVDYRRSAGRDGRRLRLRSSLRLTPLTQTAPALGSAKRRDEEHVGRG